MNYSKKNRKAFTLVELIVVIAIVAILAAVSVVSYIAFINSANESADIQLVKQLNTFLQGDETLHGTRDTMDEMLTVMLDHGFFVENLTRTASGNDIVWDQANNRFALVNDSGKVWAEDSFADAPKYQVWYFVNSIEEAEQRSNTGHYSVYLTEDVGNQLVLNISTGFDTGKNIIETVNYAHTGEKQVVTFRTNSFGTTLNINAPSDEIHHYNNLGKLVATKLDYSCYYEHGTLAYAEVDEGKVVADGGKISVLYATTANKVAVEERNEGDVVNAYCTATSEQMKDSDYKAFSDSKGGNVDFGYKPQEEIENEGASVLDEAQEDEVINKPQNFVARIGAKGYLSINDAINDVASNLVLHVIKVLRQSQSGFIFVGSNKNILIDFDNYNLSFNSAVRIQYHQNGILKTMNMGTCLIVDENASLKMINIHECKIGLTGPIMCNAGNLEIDGGLFENTANRSLAYGLQTFDGSRTFLNNLTLKCVTYSGSVGQQTIQNGMQPYDSNNLAFIHFKNNCVIECAANDAVNNFGNVVIDGGFFKGNGSSVINSHHSNCNVEINGGCFESTSGRSCISSQTGVNVINGGTFNSEIENNDHTTINGNVVDNGDGTWTVIPNP